MAFPTNTFSTFAAIGTREDLKDFIANISPTDCPFTNMVGKAKAENTYFEWQTDALAAPNTGNAQIEGDDTSSPPSRPRSGWATGRRSATLPSCSPARKRR